MNRDEILNRNKAGKPKDEREVYLKDKARRYGEIGLCAVFILLIIYKTIKGIPCNDLLAMFWGYLGLQFVYRYRAKGENASLLSAVCGMIAAVAFFAAYILQTW
jgi:hypothetical protein